MNGQKKNCGSGEWIAMLFYSFHIIPYLLPELGEEAGGSTGEVGGALAGEKAAINLDVVLQHLETVA